MRTAATILVLLACANAAHAGRILNGSFGNLYRDLRVEELDPLTGLRAPLLVEAPPACSAAALEACADGAGRIYFIDGAPVTAERRLATADLCTGYITRVPTHFYPVFLRFDIDDSRLIGVYHFVGGNYNFVAEIDPASGILHRLRTTFEGRMQGCALDDRRNLLYVARSFHLGGGFYETRLLVLDMATDAIVGDHLLTPYASSFCASEGIRALEYDPVGDRLLAVSNWCLHDSDVLAIDPASGTVTTLATVPGGTPQPANCAFDPIARLLVIPTGDCAGLVFTIDVDSGRRVATFTFPAGWNSLWLVYDPDALPCPSVDHPCAIPGPLPADVGDGLRVRDHGDARAADVTAWLDWSLDRGAPRAGEHHHVLRGSRPDWLVRIEGLEAHVGAELLDSTPAVTSRPACLYYAVVAANECEDESLD